MRMRLMPLQTLVALSMTTNVVLAVMCGRWIYANARAICQMEEVASGIGMERRFGLLGGGMDVHGFRVGDDMAVLMKAPSGHLSFVSREHGTGRQFTLLNGLLEARWTVDGGRCIGLKVTHDGKPLKLPDGWLKDERGSPDGESAF